MSETLGTLCDKLTITRLKRFHNGDYNRQVDLDEQIERLIEEVDRLVAKAFRGEISLKKLAFPANKVYTKEGNETRKFTGTLGRLIASLAQVNCELWHVQEKVYTFEEIPADQKDLVAKQLSVINLERNECIDGIDKAFIAFLSDTE